jgi:hypothetical protein
MAQAESKPPSLYASAPVFVKASQASGGIPPTIDSTGPSATIGEASAATHSDGAQPAAAQAPAPVTAAPTPAIPTLVKTDPEHAASPSATAASLNSAVTTGAPALKPGERKRSDSEERAREARAKEYEREHEKRMQLQRDREARARAREAPTERHYRPAPPDERRVEPDVHERERERLRTYERERERSRGRLPLNERLSEPRYLPPPPLPPPPPPPPVVADNRYHDPRFPRPPLAYPPYDPSRSQPVLAPPPPVASLVPSADWYRGAAALPPLPPPPPPPPVPPQTAAERRSTIKEREKEAEIYKRERALSAEARRERYQPEERGRLQDKIFPPDDPRAPIDHTRSPSRDMRIRSPEMSRMPVDARATASPHVRHAMDEGRPPVRQPPPAHEYRPFAAEPPRTEHKPNYYPEERPAPPARPPLADPRYAAPLPEYRPPPIEERKPAYYPEQRHPPRKDDDRRMPIEQPPRPAPVREQRSQAPAELRVSPTLEPRVSPQEERKPSYYPEERQPIRPPPPVEDGSTSSAPSPPSAPAAAVALAVPTAAATAASSFSSAPVHALPAKPSLTPLTGDASTPARLAQHFQPRETVQPPAVHGSAPPQPTGNIPLLADRIGPLVPEPVASANGNPLISRIGPPPNAAPPTQMSPNLSAPAQYPPAVSAPSGLVTAQQQTHAPASSAPTSSTDIRPKIEPADDTRSLHSNGRERTFSAAGAPATFASPGAHPAAERTRIPSNASLPPRPASPPRDRTVSSSHSAPRMDDRAPMNVSAGRPPAEPRGYPGVMRPPPDDRAYRQDYSRHPPPDDRGRERRYSEMATPAPRPFSPPTPHYRPESAAQYREPAYVAPPPPPPPNPPNWTYDDFMRRRAADAAAAEWEHERSRPREAYGEWGLRERERLAAGSAPPTLLTRLSEPPPPPGALGYRDERDAYGAPLPPRVRPRSPSEIYGGPPAKRAREEGYPPPAAYYPSEYAQRDPAREPPLPPSAAYYPPPPPRPHEGYASYEYDPRAPAPQPLPPPRDAHNPYYADERRYAPPPPRRL